MSGRIVIAGGGIGGLTLANALHRLQIPFLVLEKRPDFSEIGFGITLSYNALARLEAIEPTLPTRLQELSADMVSRVQLPCGKHIFTQPHVPAQYQKWGKWAGRSLHRQCLHQELLRGLPQGSVVHGRKVIDFTQDPKGVQVKLDDGSVLDASMLIGADGIFSAVREALHDKYTDQLGERPQPRYCGITSVGFVLDNFDYSSLRLTQGEAGMYGDSYPFNWVMGDNYSAIFLPLADGKLTFGFQVNNIDSEETKLQLMSAVRKDPKAFMSDRSDFVKSCVYPLDTLLDSLGPQQLVVWDMIELVYPSEPKRWGHGLVTLLGDSAHAMQPWLGQGACQGIEDAYNLAVNIRDMGLTAEAVKQYEATRIPRTRMVQKGAAMQGALIMSRNPVIKFLRNLSFQAMQKLPSSLLFRAQLRWLFVHDNPPVVPLFERVQDVNV
eukprot:g52724.t1